ncbi:hypothetical protein DSO57_1037202 [Entomophthora muscae]|uniref:Uncharacterized protein n=1 Tax=Entomophthora muscae TaxID=34485 RepID=A0ACC2RPY3_9FUNG|nr:hypothetical protein DSO57_1037202 [Entomophthora muscae]
MVTGPIGFAVTGLNLGALAHKIGSLFPLKWVPDNLLGLKILIHIFEAGCLGAVYFFNPGFSRDTGFSFSNLGVPGEAI